ncbi:MAG: hypothetical protein ACE37E_11240 [Hyphomicrobiales bacterium]
MTQEKTKPPPHSDPSYPALEIDYELYMRMLEDSEWNDEQKREFIETMWSIIVSFVDLGFGVHPVQQAQDACAQIEDRSGVGADDLVSSWDEANSEKDSDQGADCLDKEAS